MESKIEDILSLCPQDLIAEYEEDLHKLLHEVRNEIEENEMVHEIPMKVPRSVCYCYSIFLLILFIITSSMRYYKLVAYYWYLVYCCIFFCVLIININPWLVWSKHFHCCKSIRLSITTITKQLWYIHRWQPVAAPNKGDLEFGHTEGVTIGKILVGTGAITWPQKLVTLSVITYGYCHHHS